MHCDGGCDCSVAIVMARVWSVVASYLVVVEHTYELQGPEVYLHDALVDGANVHVGPVEGKTRYPSPHRANAAR